MVYGNPVTSQAMAFCAEKDDGYYANPGVCQTFIKCWQKMGSEFACPDNLIWDDRNGLNSAFLCCFIQLSRKKIL